MFLSLSFAKLDPDCPTFPSLTVARQAGHAQNQAPGRREGHGQQPFEGVTPPDLREKSARQHKALPGASTVVSAITLV